MNVAHPIGDPMAYPIRVHRVYPNRPRIARIESCHVSPFLDYSSIHRYGHISGWMP